MALKRLLWTLCFILLATAETKAGPIGAAVGAVVGSIFSAGTFVKLAVGLAINIGVSLYQQAKARKAAKKRQSQSSGVTVSVQMGDTLPRSFLLGTRATAGRRKYIGSWGSDGSTPNAYLTDVIELSCLPSHAGPQGLDEAWFGDVKGTILWGEPHPDGRGYPVGQFRVGGADYLWVKYLDGTQTVADPFLRSKFGNHASRPWKSTMIGRGCQLVIVTMRVNTDLFKGGLMACLFQPKPMRLYDVRQDSTAGGDGPQRWTDKSTWASSDNMGIMIYNVARGIYYGDRWLHGGRNFSAYRLPASSFIAAINEADRAMEGARRQFRGGLEVFVNSEGLDTIEELRLGCSGRLAEVGGRIKLLIGSPAGAVYSFTDAGIVVTQEQDFEPFPSISATHNTITATYPEPAQKWAEKDAPEQSSAALVARDGGQVLSVPMQFDAVPFSAQVQCLMATMIEEEQRWRTHEFVLPPSASALEPNDVVSWSSNRNSYSNKKFFVYRINRISGCLFRVVLKEVEPGDYDPPSIIIPPVVGWIGPVPVPPQPMYGWQVLPAYLPNANGQPWRPSIEVRCAPDQDDVQAIRVQVKLVSSDQTVFDSDTIRYEAPYAWTLNAIFAGKADYMARGRFIPTSDRATEWSAWLPVTTPDIDAGDVMVGLANTRDDVRNRMAELQADINLLQEKMETLSLSYSTDGVVGQLDRQVMRSEIGNASAAIIEESEVRASATAALARRISGVQASLGDVLAEGYLAITAQTDGDTLSKIELAARARKGEATALAAMILEVLDIGGVLQTAVSFYADRFRIVAPNGEGAQGVFEFDENGAKLAVSNIGHVKSALIELGDGSVIIDENGFVVSAS